jgi:hypothetical protein
VQRKKKNKILINRRERVKKREIFFQGFDVISGLFCENDVQVFYLFVG